jgi:putative FmdB family regulatory protein
MPTYTYRCTKCGHRFELFHGIKDNARKRCPRCKGLARRVPSGGTGLLFKGTGFHITDYRSKSYKEKARQEKGTPAAGGEKKPKSPAGE